MDTRFTYTNFPKTSGTPTKKSKAEAEEITKEQLPHYYYGVPSGFIEVLTSYQKKRKNIRTATQEEYKIEEERVKDMCKRNMDALRNIDSVFLPINIPHYKDGVDAQDIVAHIKCAASRRYSVPNLPTIAVTDVGYAFPAYETW